MRITHGKRGRLLRAAVALAAIYIAVKYAFGIILPFLAAYILGALVARLAKKSHERLGGAARAWSMFYISVFFSLSAIILALALKYVGEQLSSLLGFISENGDSIAEAVKDFADTLAALPSKLPFLRELQIPSVGEYIKNALSSLGENLAENGGKAIAAGLGKILLGTPAALVGVLVFLMSSFYIAVDCYKIKDYIFSLASAEAREKAEKTYHRVTNGTRRYISVYFKMFLLTFSELCAGFLLLRVDYAIILAALLAALDVLPFFGAPLVLFVWGAVWLASGNVAGGVGMFILCAAVAISRQIIEPRLVGKGFGLHPLAALAGMYVGIRLLGFVGVIFAPVALIIVKEILESKKGE